MVLIRTDQETVPFALKNAVVKETIFEQESILI